MRGCAIACYRARSTEPRRYRDTFSEPKVHRGSGVSFTVLFGNITGWQSKGKGLIATTNSSLGLTKGNGSTIQMNVPRGHAHDPMHGITLEMILTYLVDHHGWTEMGIRIPIRCFTTSPTVKSSLAFLRKTPWARQKVEAWYREEISA